MKRKQVVAYVSPAKKKNAKNKGYGGAKYGVVPGVTRSIGYYGRYTNPAKPELKFFDTSLSGTIDATAEIPATGGQINLVPQGDTQSQRVGRKIIIRSIHVKGTAFLAPAASANASEVAYMYLIWDKQCNGAAATVGDANSGVFTSANLSVAYMTLANKSRFVILKKWIWTFNAGAGVTTAYNTVARNFDFFKKCMIPIEFDASATTGAITTIRSNNCFLVWGTTGTTDDVVSVTGAIRIRYMDA